MSITPLPYLPPADRLRDPEARRPSNPEGGLARGAEWTPLPAGSPQEAERRDQLILHYLPLVKFIAVRLAGRLPSHVELDDLIEAGIIGLIDAISKYDPAHQTKFKTYAEFRIRGAILDELRALDWVPRSTRQKSARLERAYGELEHRLGRSATDSEMMEHLKVGAEEFDLLIREARGAALVSLDELRAETGDGFEFQLAGCLADPAAEDPVEGINAVQVRQVVAAALGQLPEKERTVVSLYYHEELTMKEIGEIMGVTESRVSQIHTKAILRLRGRLLKALER